MKQCWDADPSNRSDAKSLYKKVKEMWKDSYNDVTDLLNTLEHDNSSKVLQTNLNASSKPYSISTSKLYQFENLPEPRNATEGKVLYL